MGLGAPYNFTLEPSGGTCTVTAKKPGYVYVAVETDNGKQGFVVVNATAKDPTSISFPISSRSICIGYTYTQKPDLAPSDAYTAYTFSSSDTNVATVSSAGKVTAKGIGTTTITATSSNNLTATYTLTVKNLPSSVTKETITTKVSELKKVINTTVEHIL